MNEEKKSEKNSTKLIGKPQKRKKITRKIIFGIIFVLILTFSITTGVFAYNNLFYVDNLVKNVFNSEFIEKKVTLKDGSIINYIEGPNKGTPLLLIHGQGMEWQDYAAVVPDLSKKYHVYAIDCYGHGKSSHNPQKYNGVLIGKDIVKFIDTVIKEPVVISGHSSGGILSAWIAANYPEKVISAVLEDPPLFSVLPEEMQNTFVWKDGFEVAHNFLKQKKEKDYVVYYMENSYLFGLFGGLQDVFVKGTKDFREKNPKNPLKLWYLPYQIGNIATYFNDFDVKFADTFYSGAWFKGLDQAETLKKINCPTIYLKVLTRYSDDGVQLAANSDEDAKKVQKLIKGCKMIKFETGHDIHFDDPKGFVKVFMDLYQ